jgi:hypothetical protein
MPSLVTQGLNQLIHEPRWFYAKLVMKKRLVLAVSVDCLGCVSLCELHLHYEATRAFTERFGLHRGQRSDEGITEVAALYQSQGSPLECLQSKQTVTLSVSHHPLVIPVREKFDTIHQEREPRQTLQTWLVDQSLGEICQVGDINSDMRV